MKYPTRITATSESGSSPPMRLPAMPNCADRIKYWKSNATRQITTITRNQILISLAASKGSNH